MRVLAVAATLSRLSTLSDSTPSFESRVQASCLWFKQALPALKAQPETSQIVVTSSVAALRGVPQGGPYAASKWAINGLVLSLREELKNSHPQVKVGLVCPGPIATAWWDEFERGGRFSLSLSSTSKAASQTVRSEDRTTAAADTQASSC